MKPDDRFVDKFLMRIKDIILVLGAIYAILGTGLKFYGLPDRVEAQEIRLIKVEEVNTTQDLKLESIQQGLSYLIKTTDEIKATVKGKLDADIHSR